MPPRSPPSLQGALLKAAIERLPIAAQDYLIASGPLLMNCYIMRMPPGSTPSANAMGPIGPRAISESGLYDTDPALLTASDQGAVDAEESAGMQALATKPSQSCPS